MNVLLTGLPSFAARKMCEELLRAPARTRVLAVVPAAERAEADAMLDELTLDERGRVQLIEGAPTSIDLGLSGAELSTLVPQVDVIHHMASDPADPEQGARAAREIAEVAALAPSLRLLVHHSSVSVFGDRTGHVLEEDVPSGALGRAERVMRERMKDLPIAIVRPTFVVGDSTTGEMGPLSGPHFLILLIVTSPADFPLPLPGRGDGAIDLVPIDYVVRAARLLGESPAARGRTFHLADPSPPTIRRVFELVAAAGGRRGPRGFLPANLTKALLKTPGLDRLARSPRAFLDALATPVLYARTNTAELLGDVACPPFESYVERLVEHVQQRLRDRRARDEEDPLG